MDQYFADDSIDTADDASQSSFSVFDANGLPTARKIQRGSFSLANGTSDTGEAVFDVDKFLTDHHQFQTLEDIQAQLQTWSTVLEKELVDLINQDYGKFVGLGASLNSGHPRVQDIKVEVLSFQKELKNIQGVLGESVTQVDSLLRKKFQVMEIENLVENLILYNEKLADSQSRVKEAAANTHSTLDSSAHYNYTLSEIEDLGTAVLACEHQLTKVPPTHPFVVAQRSRLIALRLHVTSAYPEFFHQFKAQQSKVNGSAKVESDSSKLFALVLLYKQIKVRIDADEALHKRAAEEESEKKRSESGEVTSSIAKEPLVRAR